MPKLLLYLVIRRAKVPLLLDFKCKYENYSGKSIKLLGGHKDEVRNFRRCK